MSNEWSFRDEILLATHKWPWLALFCLVGCLVGWGISFVWPTPHRATTELYVGLNTYRSSEDLNATEYAGIELVNANDYKNWQMASLNSMTTMDEVIQETLQRLRQLDPYWQTVSPAELAKSLHVYWRNAGKWRLAAENKNPQQAVQAVTTWQDVVLEQVHTAVNESQHAMVLVFQLKSLALAQSYLIVNVETLQQTLSVLLEWQTDLSAVSPDLPLDSAERWQLWQAIAQNNPDPVWTLALADFPAPQAARTEYAAWIEKTLPLLKEIMHSRENQIEALDAQQSEVKSQFKAASQISRGLSATLDVEKISGARTEQSVVRPTGMLVLVGSLIGLVVWLIQWLAGISLRGHP